MKYSNYKTKYIFFYNNIAATRFIYRYDKIFFECCIFED